MKDKKRWVILCSSTQVSCGDLKITWLFLSSPTVKVSVTIICVKEVIRRMDILDQLNVWARITAWIIQMIIAEFRPIISLYCKQRAGKGQKEENKACWVRTDNFHSGKFQDLFYWGQTTSTQEISGSVLFFANFSSAFYTCAEPNYIRLVLRIAKLIGKNIMPMTNATAGWVSTCALFRTFNKHLCYLGNCSIGD